MATINWSVTTFGRTAADTVASLGQSASGAHTSTGTASDISGLSLKPGEILEVTPSADAWLNAQGTAAVGTGRFLGAGVTRYFQASEAASGPVSVIDA